MAMNQAFRAVLFDLDGTLLDTLADIAAAMNTALAARDLPTHPVDAYRRMVGSGLEMLVRRAVPADLTGDEERIRELTVHLREEYARHPADRTVPYDGVRELIAELRRRYGLPLAVLSNKADALVQAIVPRFFLPDDFVAVRGLADGMPAKPDPASSLAIASAIGVAPELVIYLGDSDVDMHTARNAGMRAIGAGWGFRGPDELVAAGAETVIMRPGELSSIVNAGVRFEEESIHE